MKATKIRNLINSIIDETLIDLPRQSLKNAVTVSVTNSLNKALGIKMGGIELPQDFTGKGSILEFSYKFDLFDSKQSFDNFLYVVVDLSSSGIIKIKLSYSILDVNHNKLFRKEITKEIKESNVEHQFLQQFSRDLGQIIFELFKSGGVVKSINQWFYNK